MPQDQPTAPIFAAITQPCPTCAGRGYLFREWLAAANEVAEVHCDTCHGNGFIVTEQPK